jgi:hypothetical protein
MIEFAGCGGTKRLEWQLLIAQSVGEYHLLPEVNLARTFCSRTSQARLGKIRSQ